MNDDFITDILWGIISFRKKRVALKVTSRKIKLVGPASLVFRHPKILDANGALVAVGIMRTLFSAEVRDIEIFITSFGELTDALLTNNDGVSNREVAEDTRFPSGS
jgi:hypothetical protein